MEIIYGKTDGLRYLSGQSSFTVRGGFGEYLAEMSAESIDDSQKFAIAREYQP